jgi:hypothetical protein
MLPSSFEGEIDGVLLEHARDDNRDLLIVRSGLELVRNSSREAVPAWEIQSAEIGLAASERAIATVGLQRVQDEIDNRKPKHLLVPLSMVQLACNAIDNKLSGSKELTRLGYKLGRHYQEVFRPQINEWAGQASPRTVN